MSFNKGHKIRKMRKIVYKAVFNKNDNKGLNHHKTASRTATESSMESIESYLEGIPFQINTENSFRTMVRKIIIEETAAPTRAPTAEITKMDTAALNIAPQVDPEFDVIVKTKFTGAIDNGSLVNTVVSIIEKQGYTSSNTLLATSLCCDELSRVLEDDFGKIYGGTFNLGGLAGFPFAGTTGFGAMSHHIPDDGNCLVVYGPHVGITKDGIVGKVEREGILKPDTCCGSAVAASNYVRAITEGCAVINTNIQPFTDFQQGAVQELILPHGRRLADSANRMLELPYAIYDSQTMLMNTIAKAGADGTKNGLILLGGIQINTGPDSPDYFHPLKFVLMNKQGKVVEDMLPLLKKYTTGIGSMWDDSSAIGMPLSDIEGESLSDMASLVDHTFVDDRDDTLTATSKPDPLGLHSDSICCGLCDYQSKDNTVGELAQFQGTTFVGERKKPKEKKSLWKRLFCRKGGTCSAFDGSVRNEIVREPLPRGIDPVAITFKPQLKRVTRTQSNPNLSIEKLPRSQKCIPNVRSKPNLILEEGKVSSFSGLRRIASRSRLAGGNVSMTGEVVYS